MQGAPNFGIFGLLFALLSGGASDLLDFVSTDAYAKAKNLPAAVEPLINEIKPQPPADVADLITKLGSATYAEREQAAQKIIATGPAAIPALEKASDDPDIEIANRTKNLITQIRTNTKAASVRKLVAIRALGEKKSREALPALQALVNSKEPFVADYAARSIAQIEGKPLPSRKPTAENLKTDLALLPANCAIVGQVALSSEKILNVEQLLKDTPPMPGENRAETLEQLNQGIISTLDKIGNVRIESVTFGVAADIGPNTGFAAAILRGKYDSRAVANVVKSLGSKSNVIDGAEVFTPEDSIAFAFVSDDRAIFTAGANANVLPVKELLAAARQNQGPLLTNKDIATLIEKNVDPSARAWAVCKVTDAYRQANVIAPFDTIVLNAVQKDDNLNIKITGQGQDAQKIADAVNQINQGLAAPRNELPKMAQQMPIFKPIADLVASIQCAADDKTATLTSTFKGDTSMLLAFPMMTFGVRAQAVPPPAPPQQQVAPVPPPPPIK